MDDCAIDTRISSVKSGATGFAAVTVAQQRYGFAAHVSREVGGTLIEEYLFGIMMLGFNTCCRCRWPAVLDCPYCLDKGWWYVVVVRRCR